MVCRGTKEQLVTWADQDPQGCRGCGDHQVGEDPEELWDAQARQESLARTGRTENLDHRVFKACLDQWEHRETRGPWENKVQPENPEPLVSRDPEGTLGKMEDPAIMGQQDPLVRQEKGAPQAVLVPEVFRACLDRLVRMVCQERMEKSVSRVHLV